MQRNYLFSESCNFKEIKTVLDNSNPKFASRILIEKVESDFNLGDFIFHIKYNRKLFTIPFHNARYNINDFWLVLEKLVSATEPLILQTFYFGEEVILYFEPIKKDVRFTAMDNFELLKLQNEGKIIKYSYIDFRVNIDVLISKKKFIKQFYTILYNLFDSYKSIAYFESPVIDFDFWINDSIKIKEYLKRKKRTQNNEELPIIEK